MSKEHLAILGRLPSGSVAVMSRPSTVTVTPSGRVPPAVPLVRRRRVRRPRPPPRGDRRRPASAAGASGSAGSCVVRAGGRGTSAAGPARQDVDRLVRVTQVAGSAGLRQRFCWWTAWVDDLSAVGSSSAATASSALAIGSSKPEPLRCQGGGRDQEEMLSAVLHGVPHPRQC